MEKTASAAGGRMKITDGPEGKNMTWEGGKAELPLLQAQPNLKVGYLIMSMGTLAAASGVYGLVTGAMSIEASFLAFILSVLILK